MAVATPAKNTPLLELKSASLTLVAVVLRSTDLAVLARDLTEREAATPGLFDNDPVALDLWRVRESDEPIDFRRAGRAVAQPPPGAGGRARRQRRADGRGAAAGLAEAPDAAAPRRRAKPTLPRRSNACAEVQRRRRRC